MTSAVISAADTYMGGLERGERNLTLRSLERIAAKIDTHPLALLGPE